MHSVAVKLKDRVYLTGLILLALSLLFYLIPTVSTDTIRTGLNGAFMVNYGFTVAFAFVLFTNGLLKRSGFKLQYTTVLFVLALISAYSLNREIAIFETSSLWFSIVLVIVCVNYLSFAFFDHFPDWAKSVTVFIAGLAFLVFLYLAIYLVPIYLFSAAALIGLGLSSHTFVPIFFCIYTFILVKRTGKYWTPFIAGIAISLLFVMIYSIKWNSESNEINKNFKYSSITENNQLPSWINVAQHMSGDAISQKILKTGLVYSVPTKDGSFFWRAPRLNFESRIHDPLVMIGSFFSGPVNVPVEDRVKILKSVYDSRHEAQERLWSGEDLITEHVSTKVKLWPEHRIAYTEQEIIVSHVPGNSSWTNSQEAIYTFHLPEGGVATSLSLWINGVEEKGILTTKGKADSAYKTIVGVESRDPSVVHWQEGNTLSVRVFPVVRGESRKFKLGITAPLTFADHNLIYNNIYFDGPSTAKAKQDVEITGDKNILKNMIFPADFKSNENYISKSGKDYDASWSVAFPSPVLSSSNFYFDNHSYSIVPITKEYESFTPQNIYLDINSSWTLEECAKIYDQIKDKNVFVAEGGEELTRVTESNNTELFEQLMRYKFSMFPFFKISNISSALVITKSAPVSPNIDDIRNSKFLEQTYSYFSSNSRVKIYNIGKELSPYLKSLKECRLLQYEGGGIEQLNDLLSKNLFVRIRENDDEIPISSAGITIKRSDSSGNGMAPDHLMRLFAYNHILQRSGISLLSDLPEAEDIITEAEQAYVVSPFSSLIVLETQKDYDRFDITSSKNSLQNASLKSKGAVPEPREWALIILVLILCAIIRFRPQLLLFKNR